MRRFVAVAGVAVITSLLPSSVVRSDVPGPAASKAPGDAAGPDAYVLRILPPQGTPVSPGPSGSQPPPVTQPPPASQPLPASQPPPISQSPPTGVKPAASEPVAAAGSPAKPPASAGNQPSVSRPHVASAKPSDSGPAPAIAPPASKPTDVQPVAAKPVVAKPAVAKPVVAKPVVAKPVADGSHGGRPAPTRHEPAANKPHKIRPANTRHDRDRPSTFSDPHAGFVILPDGTIIDVYPGAPTMIDALMAGADMPAEWLGAQRTAGDLADVGLGIDEILRWTH
jgi:hypothetical protein